MSVSKRATIRPVSRLQSSNYQRDVLTRQSAPSGRRSDLPYSTNQAARPNKRPKFYFVVALLAMTIIGTGWTHHASAQDAQKKRVEQAQAAHLLRQKNAIDLQIQQIVRSASQVTTGIAVYSSTGDQFTVGADQSYDAASLGKLITAAAYLHGVDSGSVQLEKQLQGETAAYWLDKMVKNSNDQAWNILNMYLTHSLLSKYATSIGLTSYDADTNSISAKDIATLLTRLQNGKLLSQPSTKRLIGAMTSANYRQYILPAVSRGDSVYHKVGFDGDTLNDAAVINRNGKWVVLVILTDGNGTYHLDDRAKLMQNITKLVSSAYL